ncbi:regulator of sigma E protease [Lachnospiraceae bacterium KHCPX20]|nr:regulator of sigma E protease [Lachnospiraceae bacterium KHCPX20]
MRIIIAILIFSIVIIFHELGHFSVAKACGVRVNEFTLGLGPTVWGFTKGETTYCLKLLPFGGSCVMEGEDEESEDARAFQKKKLWQKFLIVFAGPFFNFILAFVLSVIMIACAGFYKPLVHEVRTGSPAEEAGLMAGDEIVKINGYNVHFYNEITVYTFFHPGQDLNITYDRNGKREQTSVTPAYDKSTKRYLMGITGNASREKAGVLTSLKYGFYEIKYQVYVVFMSLKELVLGHVGINDMSGPVGIVKTIGDTYQQSLTSGIFYVVMNMLSITILLTSNLGVMNLLPFPALDGGRLLIFLLEGITKRKIPEKVEGTINMVGFVLLMGLMIVIMGNDIRKLFLH